MKEILNSWLVRQQLNPRRSNFQLDESLRPFGFPLFPEEVTEKKIVLSTLSSSGGFFLKWFFLSLAIVFAIMYSFLQSLDPFIFVIVCLFCAFYPMRSPEMITISPLGISLSNSIFVFKNTTTIPRNEIVRLNVDENTWGIYFNANISVTLVNSRIKKLFSLTRKNHTEIVEDSQKVVENIRKMLSV